MMNVKQSVVAIALVSVCVTGCVAPGRVDQMPRNLPTYDASVRLSSRARVALYSNEKVAPGLVRRLEAAGCELVPSAPTTGAHGPERIVELVRCSQDTEWSGGTVSLVTVLVIRVRRPGQMGKNAKTLVAQRGARAFQAVSRQELGARTFNDERITEQERQTGIELALDNLMRIRAFGEALGSAR